MIHKALLIVNPAARRGTRDLRDVQAVFRARGVACDTRLTAAAGDAAALAAAAGAAYDAIFTLGGDGTAMEALAALAGTQTPLAPLPGGTGNLLARALGIPLNPVRAAAVLSAGRLRILDLARLASRGCFAVAAGVGLDVAMLQRATPARKRRLGVGAYLLAGTSSAFGGVLRRRQFEAQVTVDGVEHNVRALSLLVANMPTVLSGLLTLAPDGAPDDGMLDVVVYSPESAMQLLRVAWRMLRGSFPDDGLVRFLRGRRIHVAVRPPHVAQADGELLPEGDLVVELLPGAARLLVPGSD